MIQLNMNNVSDSGTVELVLVNCGGENLDKEVGVIKKKFGEGNVKYVKVRSERGRRGRQGSERRQERLRKPVMTPNHTAVAVTNKTLLTTNLLD